MFKWGEVGRKVVYFRIKGLRWRVCGRVLKEVYDLEIMCVYGCWECWKGKEG